MYFVPYVEGQQQLIHGAPLDVAVAPGDTLQELLDEQGMTQAEFARRTGLTTKHVNQVIKGIVPISADVAQKFERVTGVPGQFWNRLEADYRSSKAANEEREHLGTYTTWLRTMPVEPLVTAGALPESPADPASRISQLLDFFKVASVEAYESLKSTPLAAFRQSKAYRIEDNAVLAWLRLGEIAAEQIDVSEYSADAVRSALPYMRALTKEPFRAALPRLVDVLSGAGVTLVFVPEISGSRAFGATRWLSATRPVIQVSVRGKTADIFWTTIFHETGHVLNPDRRAIIAETDEDSLLNPDTVESERKAVEFARDTLIPKEQRARISQLNSLTDAADLADSIGIDVGIVLAECVRLGGWDIRETYRGRQRISDADLPGSGVTLQRRGRREWRVPGASR